MPILFIHGVSVRDESGWQQIELLLRTYVAPKIAPDPENVQITYCFWGDQGSKLSWLGSSIPDSPATIALKTSIKNVRKGRQKLASLSKTAFKNPRFLKVKDRKRQSEFRTHIIGRLASLSREQLSDVCTAAIMQNRLFSKKEQALLSVAADDVIHKDESMHALKRCNTFEQETAFLQAEISKRYDELSGGDYHMIDRLHAESEVARETEMASDDADEPGNGPLEKVDRRKSSIGQKVQLAGQELVEKAKTGEQLIKKKIEARIELRKRQYQDLKQNVSETLRYENIKQRLDDRLAQHAIWAHHFTNDVKEHLTRAAFTPAFAATRVAMEMRAPLNKFVSRFLGDVFTYLYKRGNATSPGPVPMRVMEHLLACRKNQIERHGEPLVVLTHSMGGQIMYDMVTHFLPRTPELEEIKIDFWCASASQVGFFEELKLFLESSDQYGSAALQTVPYPGGKHLGYWWNVWDHNDFVSYSAKGVIDGVDDEFYNTGLDIIAAHVGYLILPSFYRKFARKVELAKQDGFVQPDVLSD